MEENQEETKDSLESGLSEELSAIDELSQLLEKTENRQKPDETSNDDEQKNGTGANDVLNDLDERESFPRAFDVCPKRLLPNDHIVCKNCPSSKWFGNRDIIKCWCREMFQIVYQSDNPDENAYTYCDRRSDEA